MASKYVMEPPPGEKRFGGESIQPNMAACAITTALIALAVVVLRLYTRFFLTEAKFQLDDGRCTLFGNGKPSANSSFASAFVCCAAICSIVLIPVSYESLSPRPRSTYRLTNSCNVQS